jgi:peptide/nickel transport system ATP-binding protein/oligopeptide transport system ATP-binding protein
MRQEETSILLITHDMGVIWEMCDRVVVMYASRIAEEAAKDDIFASPAHPWQWIPTGSRPFPVRCRHP